MRLFPRMTCCIPSKAAVVLMYLVSGAAVCVSLAVAQSEADKDEAKNEAPKPPDLSPPPAKPKSSDDFDQPIKPRDLGPPLVDDVKSLQQLGHYQAWLDAKGKQVVLMGEVCKADYPLEFLITDRGRGYESVIMIDGRKPSEKALSIYMQVHKSLLLLGAKPGTTARYDEKKQEMIPATGGEVEIHLRWKNKEGKTQQCAAQEWIRYKATKKALDKNWVFAGSGFTDDGDGHMLYKADGGDFICVLNSPLAMIDLPVKSATAIEDRMFEAFTEHLPPGGTAVTILIKPVEKKK